MQSKSGQTTTLKIQAAAETYTHKVRVYETENSVWIKQKAAKKRYV